MKRLSAFFLCIVMLAGLMTLPANAASDDFDADIILDPEYIVAAPEPAAVAKTEAVPAGTASAPAMNAEADDKTANALDEMMEGASENPAVTSGEISGTDIRWAVKDGVLTVSGTGAIPNFLDKGAPWYDCRAIIHSIVVEKGITSVGSYAFRNLGNATRVSLPEGLTSIAKCGFCYCISLASCELPSTVTDIGPRAFDNCNGLKEIKLPEGLKTIGDYAFAFTVLTSLTLPSTLESVGEYICGPSANLTELTLPGSLKAIGQGAFGDLQKLRTVTVSEGVTALPRQCFAGCIALETLSLPSTIRSLGADFAPMQLETLKTITVAPRQGYTLECWVDEAGSAFTIDDLLAGMAVSGELSAIWLKDWTDGMFTDVAGNAWYHDAAQFCYQTELMVGTSDTKFSPDQYATRAQVVAVLYRLADSPAVSGSSGFTDVADGTWYTDAVTWAVQNGITAGITKDTFAPNRKVTREQFVTFLYRFSDFNGLIANDWGGKDYSLGIGFVDADKISDWALPAENWSVAVGLQVGSPVSQGSTERQLSPGGTLRRSEMAQFLYSYITNLDTMALIDAAEALMGESADGLKDIFGEPDSKESMVIEDVHYYLWAYDSLGFSILTEWDDAHDREIIRGIQFADAVRA